MNFSQAYPTTLQTHFGNTFQFAPSASAVLFTQAGTITNTCASGNSFDIGNVANKLKVHCETSCQVFMRDSSEQHNARINRAAQNHSRLKDRRMMKSTRPPLRLNELLGCALRKLSSMLKH
jgi:hypothetical protein